MDDTDMMQGDWSMFTALSETVSEGVTLTDKTGRFTVYNALMKEITGYSSSEAGTLDEYLALLFQDAAGNGKAMIEIRELFHRECRDRETVIRARDGTRKNVCVSTSPFECRGGGYLLHVYRDSTSRKRVEEKRLTAEKRYRLLGEQMFDAVVVVDPETFLPIDFNKRASDLFGYSEEEFSGIRIDQLETRGDFVKRMVRDNHMPAEEWDDIESEVYSKNVGTKYVKISVRVFEIAERRIFQCVFREIAGGKSVVLREDKGDVDFHEAHVKTKTLTGTLPICYVCKKICDDQGSWRQVEAYVGERSDVLFSHELCPACEHRFYPKPLSGQNQKSR